MPLTDLDTTDTEILKLLQKDAGFTNKEIAAQLYKSVATIITIVAGKFT